MSGKTAAVLHCCGNPISERTKLIKLVPSAWGCCLAATMRGTSQLAGAAHGNTCALELCPEGSLRGPGAVMGNR
jgi:hypothetical protein